MDLFILRHGQSDQRTKTTINDSKRSLTEAGKKELEEVVRALNRLDIVFDYVFYSPLARAHQTASIIIRGIKSKNKEQLSELSPEGSRSEIYKKLSLLKQDSSVLLVGHEPYLSQLVSEIISDRPDCRIDLKKAGIVRIRVISYTPNLRGEVRWLLTPKHLRYIAR